MFERGRSKYAVVRGSSCGERNGYRRKREKEKEEGGGGVTEPRKLKKTRET